MDFMKQIGHGLLDHIPKPDIAAGLELPKLGKPIEGMCQQTDNLEPITEISDLKRHIDDLECIFATGIADDWAYERGNHPGELLSAINMPGLSSFINRLYRGEYSSDYNCPGGTRTFGTTKLGDQVAAVGLWEQLYFEEEHPFLHLGPGQAPLVDGFKYLVMDYRVDPSQICPYGPNSQFGTDSLLGLKSSILPAADYIDIATPVGRNHRSGDLIMLAKAFGRTPASSTYDDEHGTINYLYGNVLFYTFELAEDGRVTSNLFWNKPAIDFEYGYKPLPQILASGPQAAQRMVDNRVRAVKRTALRVKNRDAIDIDPVRYVKGRIPMPFN